MSTGGFKPRPARAPEFSKQTHQPLRDDQDNNEHSQSLNVNGTHEGGWESEGAAMKPLKGEDAPRPTRNREKQRNRDKPRERETGTDE